MRRFTIAVAVVALLLTAAGATGAVKHLITGRDIRDGTIHGRDLAHGTIPYNRLSTGTQHLLRASQQTSAESQSPSAGPKGDKGDAGAPGPSGPQGPRGPKGDDASLPSAGNWGIIDRNTIGAPDQALRSGPADPPNGSGSLNLAVEGNPDYSVAQKAAWGDETDFAGRLLSSIANVGFWVFTTGEDSGRGNPNMPNITFEVLRTGTGSYASLVYVPANSTANQWSDYINAATTPSAPSGGTGWYYTGSGNTCQLSSPCTFAAAKAEYPDAKILTVAVTKGRDFSWQGAVDGLRINDTIYDFEEHGVVASGA